jgi:two-component sensor histidine kinase
VKSWWRRFADRRMDLDWFSSAVLAIACVALATAARVAVGWLVGPTLPFVTYFPAILFAALFGGVWAGIMSIPLSILVVWWAFTPPYYEFAPLTLSQLANIVLFAFSSGLVVWLADVHRSLLRSADMQEQQRQLLVGEVQHRSKNILTVVESLVRQTMTEPDRAQTLINRIRAVVSTQDLLDSSHTPTADLRALLAEELAGNYGASRIRLDGPPVALNATTARALRLVIHEMATNALKHGALSESNGKVAVDWSVDGVSLTLNWSEHGGPKVTAPSSYHFGSKLITRTLKALNANFEPTFAETGYCYRMTIPLVD